MDKAQLNGEERTALHSQPPKIRSMAILEHRRQGVHDLYQADEKVVTAQSTSSTVAES